MVGNMKEQDVILQALMTSLINSVIYDDNEEADKICEAIALYENKKDD